MSADADQSNPLNERGGWVRWLVLAVGVVFLLPVASNLGQRDWANAGAGLGVAVLGIGSSLLMTWNRRGRRGLLEWVGRHREDIRAGVASFEGRPVRLDTKVRTYRTSISLLVVSYWFASRFVLEGEREGGFVKWSATLASLLLGWWGIPFGPVYTLQALYRNLAGGDQITVADLLSQLPR
jgi:hypothetical protein